MATLKINGKEITVDKGTTVMKAAEKLGIFIPRYCFHPALSIAGSCRMCLVEVEKMPKPAIACQTQCQDGMNVFTDSDKVKKLRQAVLEFLLINHPLDCPVCDQAGECELQDYYMQYGLFDSRLNEKKVKKHKAVSLGKTVMLDSERCVLCARCVRFTDEVTETHELGIFNRGDNSEVGLLPEKELRNPYSGNVVDLCPVGALTDKDFRFKCRVWYLKSGASICTGCSRGCNTRIDYNLDRPHHGHGNRVMRVKPRENQEVNRWWICDEGRYNYKFIDENRILTPQVKTTEALRRISLSEALRVFADTISGSKPQEIGILASTQLTNEDLFAIHKFFKDTLGFTNLDYRLPIPDGESDDFLRTSDKSPNTRGAYEIIKKTRVNGNEIILKARKGEIKTLIVFGYDLKEIYGDKTLEELRASLKQLIFVGSNNNSTSEIADLTIPSSVYAEKNGTFTNHDGRVQKITKTFGSLGEVKPEWEIIKLLAENLEKDFPYGSAEEVMAGLGEDVSLFYGMNYSFIGEGGALLGAAAAKGARRKD